MDATGPDPDLTRTAPTRTALTRTALTRSAVRAATLRLLPLLGLAYLLNYLDRANVSFAQLRMGRDLGLSPAAFGLGAGLFFVGYFFFEIPSNVILHRVGARIWIARIMITWGLVASATAFVQGEASFYVARVLLGFAEAGFFPGIILYLTHWFPRIDRARIVALFFLAVPLSSVIGAPVSTLLIENGDGVLGFDAGWRLMYFVEGLPALLVGVAVLFLMPEWPNRARWLSREQASALEATIAAEDERAVPHPTGLRAGLADPRVVALAACYFGVVFGLYVLGFFLPQILVQFQADFGVRYSLVEIGLITAIPYAVASVAMFLWSRRSDRSGERPLHVAVPALLGAVGIVVAQVGGSPVVVMVGVTICAVGVFAAIPPFWSLPDGFLTGVGAAAGIALINSFGNLSGFAGPVVSGWLQTATGNARAGLWVVAGTMVVSGVIALGFRRAGRAAPADTADAARR